MRPCGKCFENNWKYLKLDGENIVTATCQNCGNEVSWEIKKKDKIDTGGKCRSCPGLLELKALKVNNKKKSKEGYYTHALRCSRCKKYYYSKDHYIKNDGFEYPKGQFRPGKPIALKGMAGDILLVLQKVNESKKNEIWVEIKRIIGKVAGTDKFGIPYGQHE